MEFSEKELLVWVAAFFDAEGCIHLDVYGRICVLVENLSLEALQLVNKIVNANVTAYKRNGKTVYRVRCYNGKAKNFLEKIIPYLIVKKDVAKYAIEYYINGCKDKEKYRRLINTTMRGDVQ